MNREKLIIFGCSLAFILLNCFAITKEIFLVPLLSAGLLFIYIAIYRFDFLVYFMAFVTPFSITFSDSKINVSLSIPSEVIMIMLTMLFFFRMLYDIRNDRQILTHPVTVAIFVYLIWLLFTSIASTFPIVSFKFLLSKIWFIVSCYFIVIQLIKKDIKKAISYINCYAIGLLGVILIVTSKHAMQGFSPYGLHWIMSPFYNDHTAYGAAIAFFIPLMAGFLFLPQNGKWQRIFYCIAILIMLTGLYLSFCRAAWLSTIGVVIILIVIKLKIKFPWLVVGIAIVAGFSYYFSDEILYKMSRNEQDSSSTFSEQIRSISNINTDASNVERLNRWVAAFGIIEDSPVLGCGPGAYQFVYASYQKGKYKTIISTNFGDGGNAHSEFIGPCAETGFPGLITVVVMMILILYFGIKTYIKAQDKMTKILSLSATLALISYYIHGVLNNFLDTDKLSLPFWGAFAIIVVLHTRLKNSFNIEKKDG